MWRPIPGHEKYEVSTEGEIRHATTKQKRRTHPNERGYLKTTLTVSGGGVYTIRVHRAVAMAHISRPQGKDSVHHKDGCRTNNSVSNLEWVTHRENMAHARANHGMKKCPAEEVREISKMVAQGYCIRDIAETHGICVQTVRNYANEVI